MSRLFWPANELQEPIISDIHIHPFPSWGYRRVHLMLGFYPGAGNLNSVSRLHDKYLTSWTILPLPRPQKAELISDPSKI